MLNNRSLISLLLLGAASADITWPAYNQQCADDAGPPFQDDEPGKYYHDTNSQAFVLEDECPEPLQAACASRPNKRTAYLEGPIDCGDKGWYCRIMPDANWPPIALTADLNFGHCNTTEGFEDAGYDRDGHCHGSSKDSTYYWWIRDHWHRQYNGRLRCCCGWYEGGDTPLYSRRIANRCDYRRLVVDEADRTTCRDANEDHGLGFDDIGCDAEKYSSQLNSPIPEEDAQCWELQKFGFSEGDTPPPSGPVTSAPVATPATSAPVVTPATSAPVVTPATSAPVVTPATSAPVATPTTSAPVVTPATSSPVVTPATSSPVVRTSAPVPVPTPTSDTECTDSPLMMYVNGRARYCYWVGAKNTQKRCKKKNVLSHCPATCDEFFSSCDDFACADSKKRFKMQKNYSKKFCLWVGREEDLVERRCAKPGVAATCRETCDYCEE